MMVQIRSQCLIHPKHEGTKNYPKEQINTRFALCVLAAKKITRCLKSVINL